MSAEPLSFKNILSGETAFYHQPNYVEDTRRDLNQEIPLPVSYTWNEESQLPILAKQIVSIFLFPIIGIYQLIHSLAAKLLILPSSTPILCGLARTYAHDLRSRLVSDGDRLVLDPWKYKRITVEVDGYKIDGMIIGTASTLNNGRWLLASAGNGMFYEQEMFYDRNVKKILTNVHSNALLFNYPGVGASSGLPNRQAMAKAYRAMLNFLEDQEKGIGAQEIIGYGYSIGGGVQGDALKTHPLKKDIKYLFIKDRTFSSISAYASNIIKPLGILPKILDWNIDSVESSKNLQASEIILQRGRVRTCTEIFDASTIEDDGEIKATASLAKALLEDKNYANKNKAFIAIPESHCDLLADRSLLSGKIEEFLQLPAPLS